MPNQGPHAVFDAVCDVCQGLAGLDVFLGPLTDLAMGLGPMAVVGQEVAVEIVQMPLLLACRPEPVLVGVLDLLALLVALVWEELRDQDARRVGLRRGVLLLLSGLPLLLFLRGSVGGGGTSILFCLSFGIVTMVLCAVRWGAGPGGLAVGTVGVVDWTGRLVS